MSKTLYFCRVCNHFLYKPEDPVSASCFDLHPENIRTAIDVEYRAMGTTDGIENSSELENQTMTSFSAVRGQLWFCELCQHHFYDLDKDGEKVFPSHLSHSSVHSSHVRGATEDEYKLYGIPPGMEEHPEPMTAAEGDLISDWATDMSKKIMDALPPQEPDTIDHPSHYTQGSIECIDAIEACGALTDFCRGNAIKYLWRMFEKDDALEDAKKAAWYLERLIKHLEKEMGGK